ncbi:DNA repair exonuclease [Halobacillus sp. A1]|uniref:metallophosphoesterase family protein n=1 Tax=Halobacillus sp. A1 TaxID=2880262 RepID=UPI0020A63F80|nr:DNA repair exonuclease [Halobacillus sp. A1]MCP3033268.1 DNA repair exonuclease [Halobacillus sp. A1]
MAGLRFIHSADLHLDSPFKSKSHLPDRLKEQIRASTFEAFERLVDEAVHFQVDFVILAGDLFNEETRSLKAQVKLREGFERLHLHNIQVYVSYGNHDFIEGAHYPITYPANVHVFMEEEVTSFPYWRDGDHVANIYGFSYKKRAVHDKKVREFKKTGEPDFHIAMLHGSLETQTEHDVYAPFSLNDLLEQGMDYWGLGHIHKRQQLSVHPPVFYSGNIQGRSRKESGEKGCYVVEWRGTQFDNTFVPLHSFTYEEVTQAAYNIEYPEAIEHLLEEAKQSVKSEQPVLLTVTLKGHEGRLMKWKSEGILSEWIDLVNERENLEYGWIWIDQIFIEDEPAWNEEELKASSQFAGEFLNNLDSLSSLEWEAAIAPLYKHRRAGKQLEEITDEEREEIKQAAKQLVMQQLFSGRESGL